MADEIQTRAAALEALPGRDGPERAAALNELASAQRQVALQQHNGSLLQEAISTVRQAVSMSEEIPDKQAAYLNNLGIYLRDLAMMEKSAVVLEQSVDALELGSRRAPDHLKSSFLLNLADALRVRCTLGFPGGIDSLERAIVTYRGGLDANPTPHDESELLNGLAVSLLEQSRAGHSSLEDLKAARDAARKAVEESDEGHPSRAVFLDTYANVLSELSAHEPPMEILSDSISLGKRAVDIAQEQRSPKHPEFVTNLARTLLRRYRIGASQSDLGDAIEMLQSTPAAVTPPNPAWRSSSVRYALALKDRFTYSGARGDIEACVALLTVLRKQWTKQEPQWASVQVAFASALIQRCQVNAAVGDLDTAVRTLENVARHLSEESPYASAGREALSATLLGFFKLRGSIADLDLPLSTAQKALGLLPETSADYPDLLVACANALLCSYKKTGASALLDDAIALYERTVTSDDAQSHLRLGNALELRYKVYGRDSDWRRFADVCKEVADLSADSPDTLCVVLIQQGSALLQKACADVDRMPGRSSLLHQAVSCLDKSLGLMPAHYAHRSSVLNSLGLACKMLCNDHRDRQACGTTLARYIEVAELPTATPLERVFAVDQALELPFGSYTSIQELSRLALLAVQLLPTLSPRLLRQQGRKFMAAKFSALGSKGASLLLHAGHDVVDALNALETSRGVVNSLLVDTRTDLTLLEERNGPLATRFENVRFQLESMSDEPPQLDSPVDSSEMSSKKRMAVVKEFDDVVAEIRGLEGLHDFLRPPTAAEYQAMAASSHIVFLSASLFRSDALVISSRRIWNIPLEKLKLEDAIARAKALADATRSNNANPEMDAKDHVRQVLNWLWDSVVNPVRTELLLHVSIGAKLRICWIPSGIMANFPIHAATDKASGDNAMDTIISSYGTSVKSLRHYQQKLTQVTDREGQALLVSMKETPGEISLPFAEEEAESLLGLLRPVMPVTMLSYPLPPQPGAAAAPTKPGVLAELDTAAVVFLGCHGVAHRHEPSSSQLLLSDWCRKRLTVGDIAARRLPFARMAYLSTCQAAADQGASPINERIHLAAAFQLAGFPQVVGTLWQVNDRRAAQVSRRVWEMLIGEGGRPRYELLAEALNEAVRELRESTKRSVYEDVNVEFADEPFLWAPFVYVGL